MNPIDLCPAIRTPQATVELSSAKKYRVPIILVQSVFMIEMAGSLLGYIVCFNPLQVVAPVLVHSIVNEGTHQDKHFKHHQQTCMEFSDVMILNDLLIFGHASQFKE